MPHHVPVPDGLRKLGISTTSDNLTDNETFAVEASDLVRLFGLELMTRLALDNGQSKTSKMKGNQDE